MKLLLLLITALLLAGCVGIAEGKGRPVDKGPPPGKAKQVTPTPTCQSTIAAVAVSGSAVHETVSRGSRTLIDDFVVTNIWEGETISVTMLVTSSGGTPLPPEWVEFVPSAFCLGFGEGEVVDVWLTVPHSARPGVYVGLFEADVCVGIFCAGAAVRATITIE